MERARLVLEDGSVFEGEAVGYRGTAVGEVVFNTSMTGYQEILTDPSYRGQIVTLTYPLIGNYGVTEEDLESDVSHARGLVVRELCGEWNSWRGRGSVERFLDAQRIVGIHRIDTRALTRKLRVSGTMRGVIGSGGTPLEALAERASKEPDVSEIDLVAEVTTRKAYEVAGEAGPDGAGGPHIALMDFGVKRNILRSLSRRGCRVTVVPAASAVGTILGLRPDAVVLSNGPGDPDRVSYAVRAARELMGRLPLFGICLGHQVLGLALGGETYKLKYGHRGANHPVQDLGTGRVAVTSQNHGFAVAEKSLDPGAVEVTHRNLNDGTVEGLRHRVLPIASVQFHPESAPGPQESAVLLDGFLESLSA